MSQERDYNDDEHIDELMRKLAEYLGLDSPEDLDGAELTPEMLAEVPEELRKEIIQAVLQRIGGSISEFEEFARSTEAQSALEEFQNQYGHLPQHEQNLIVAGQVAAGLDSVEQIQLHIMNRKGMMWNWLTELLERIVAIVGSKECISMLESAAAHIESNLITGEIPQLIEAEELYQTSVEALEARKIELAVVGDSGSNTGLDDAPGFYL